MGLLGKERYAFVYFQAVQQPDGKQGVIPLGFVEGEKRTWGRDLQEDVRVVSSNYFSKFCRKYTQCKAIPTWAYYGKIDKNNRFECSERFLFKQTADGKVLIGRDESAWGKLAIERIDALDSGDAGQLNQMRLVVYPPR